jgi:hypothetical protein
MIRYKENKPLLTAKKWMKTNRKIDETLKNKVMRGWFKWPRCNQPQ